MTTSRLLLRPIRQSDLVHFHALRTQIEVMKWTSTAKIDVDQEARQVWMDRYLPPNDATTFNFAVEELAIHGKAIGVLGCHIAEPPEVGYMLNQEAWGNGYATEALQRWLQAWWELPRAEVSTDEGAPDAENVENDIFVPEVLMADINGDNHASARILAKCGFRHVSEEMVEANGAMIKLVTYKLDRPR